MDRAHSTSDGAESGRQASGADRADQVASRELEEGRTGGVLGHEEIGQRPDHGVQPVGRAFADMAGRGRVAHRGLEVGPRVVGQVRGDMPDAALFLVRENDSAHLTSTKGAVLCTASMVNWTFSAP